MGGEAEVDGSTAAGCRTEAAHSAGSDQVVHVVVGQRRKPGRMIGQYLRGRSAEPEQNQRPEDRVLDDSGEQLGTARGQRLDHHSARQIAEAYFDVHREVVSACRRPTTTSEVLWRCRSAGSPGCPSGTPRSPRRTGASAATSSVSRRVRRRASGRPGRTVPGGPGRAVEVVRGRSHQCPPRGPVSRRAAASKANPISQGIEAVMAAGALHRLPIFAASSWASYHVTTWQAASGPGARCLSRPLQLPASAPSRPTWWGPAAHRRQRCRSPRHRSAPWCR